MRGLLSLLVLLLSACGAPPKPAGPIDRLPGVRAPRSAACESLDGTRCLLPWPSNTYTVADPSTATGLRVALNISSLPVLDNPASLNRADGFSVVTPLAVGFPSRVSASLSGQKGTHAVRLFQVQPGTPGFGHEVPLRLEVVSDSTSPAAMILAWPMRPLEYATDYLALATDEIHAEDGSALEPLRTVQVALGTTPPGTDDERALAAYHAPSRALLAQVGVDATHVLRLWDFTTRSAASVSTAPRAMRVQALEAVDAGTLEVRVESATLLAQGAALDVRGHVGGLPSFLAADGGLLALDAQGLAVRQGVHETPFRAVLPAGDGGFPLVVFGHGTGGTVYDTAFDAEIVAAGAGKLNLEFAGWTGDTVFPTLVSFEHIYTGTDRATARLAQALADASALESSLGGQLGVALAAPTLAGKVNPAAGRHAQLDQLVYAGGSLGGTMGYAHTQNESRFHAAVLNVPGAGWTHFSFESELWGTLDEAFRGSTPSSIDRALGMAMTQTNWDQVDGAAWSAMADHPTPIYLLQESIGDPVLPNLGTELLAVSAGAVQVGKVIVPVLGVEPAPEAIGRTALTQYRVPASVTGSLSIHGFGDGDTAAGVAARQQIAAFLASVWAGQPRIVVPPGCLANGAQGCDFRAP